MMAGCRRGASGARAAVCELGLTKRHRAHRHERGSYCGCVYECQRLFAPLACWEGELAPVGQNLGLKRHRAWVARGTATGPPAAETTHPVRCRSAPLSGPWPRDGGTPEWGRRHRKCIFEIIDVVEAPPVALGLLAHGMLDVGDGMPVGAALRGRAGAPFVPIGRCPLRARWLDEWVDGHVRHDENGSGAAIGQLALGQIRVAHKQVSHCAHFVGLKAAEEAVGAAPAGRERGEGGEWSKAQLPE